MRIHPQNEKRFNIIRFYRKEGKPSKVIAKNLTEKQKDEWVNDPTTRKAGVYFDGFSEITNN